MQIDGGTHWHGDHGRGLSNPIARNVERWRRVIDDAAPILAGMGIRVLNASTVSALRNYPRIDLLEALDEPARNAA
jgi:hypothetical protein